MDRTNNIVRMVVASTICQLVILLCGLILPPLLISHYGSEINGLLNMVKQLMAYFSLVCLGLGVSAQVALYEPIVNNDWKSINSILAAANYFYNRSGIIFAILIFASSFIVPYIISSNIPIHEIVIIILITGIGSIFEYVIISKYKIFLSAVQKQYINSRITAEGILLNTIITIILVKCNFNIIIIQLGASIIYFLRLLYTVKYVKKHYPLISFNSEKPAFDRMNNRWNAFSYQISKMLINLSPMIIVSVFGSLKDASVFSVYFLVFSSLTMIAAIFSSGIQAPFGDIIARNEIETLKDAFSSFEFIFTLILSICFCSGMLLMISFVGSYVHNNDGVNYLLPSFSFCMCILYFITNYRIPFTTLIEAKGLFKENNKYNIIEAILFIILSVLLVNKYGVLGIAIAGIITGLPRTIHFVIFCNKYFNNVVNLSKISIKFCATIITSVLLYNIFKPSIYSNILHWFFNAIPYVCMCIIIITLLHILIDFRAFILIYKRIKNKINI